MAKKAKAKGTKAKRAKASPPPTLCSCPAGSRARQRGAETVCVAGEREGKARIVERDCSVRPREYTIEAPRTRTDARTEGKSKSIIITEPGLNYTTASKPCTTSRAGCPVQLVFRDGVPHLRFCRKAGSGEPGYLVKVADPSDARRLAAKACAQWRATGHAEVIEVKKAGKVQKKEVWRGEFDAGNAAVERSGGALGRTRRRRRHRAFA